MSIDFKIKNPGKVTTALLRRSSKFKKIAIREYTLGADRFITDIRSKYYSGRSGNIGLNKRSGNLHKRWLPSVITEGFDVVATISNEMFYGPIWEFGADKRTFVTEEMMGGSGQQIFSDAIKKALKEAF